MKKGLHVIRSLWKDAKKFPTLDDSYYRVPAQDERGTQAEDTVASIFHDPITASFCEFEAYFTQAIAFIIHDTL